MLRLVGPQGGVQDSHVPAPGYVRDSATWNTATAVVNSGSNPPAAGCLWRG